ncbi:MAG: peptidase M28 family protein, partial [Pseudomonadota bacterium]
MKATVAMLGLLMFAFAHAETFFSDEDVAIAKTLREQALESDRAFEITADLTTRVGHRLAGSPNDARGVAWAVEKLESLGFDRVWTEPVTFPNWARNQERVQLIAPYKKELVAIALGFSPATPAGGIEAEAVMLDDVAALEAVEPAEVEGKIVFIRNRMQRARDGSGYGPAVRARSVGSMIAAEKGAAAL